MDKSKRNLAKVLGVAGASAAVWKKPAVDTVILPTHATTSCETCVPGYPQSPSDNDEVSRSVALSLSCEDCVKNCMEYYPNSIAAVWGGQEDGDREECYCYNEIVGDCLEEISPSSYYFTTMLNNDCPPETICPSEVPN